MRMPQQSRWNVLFAITDYNINIDTTMTILHFVTELLNATEYNKAIIFNSTKYKTVIGTGIGNQSSYPSIVSKTQVALCNKIKNLY